MHRFLAHPMRALYVFYRCFNLILFRFKTMTGEKSIRIISRSSKSHCGVVFVRIWPSDPVSQVPLRFRTLSTESCAAQKHNLGTFSQLPQDKLRVFHLPWPFNFLNAPTCRRRVVHSTCSRRVIHSRESRADRLKISTFSARTNNTELQL